MSVVPVGFESVKVLNEFRDATSMAFTPDGRVLVAQQGGTLAVVGNVSGPGPATKGDFLHVSTDNAGERGLLGVAVDPDFASNGFVYVYYTVSGGPQGAFNRVSRFTAGAADPDVVEAGSESVLMDLDPLGGAFNHNGGALHFGPDGKLYVAVGDNTNPPNAQSLSTRHGKVLRLNADGTIPPDNPFYNQASGVYRSIWALGLRNPFTFAFAPGTGRMFINDVGETGWEEVNEGVAGANFGWPATEGPFDAAQHPQFTNPVYAYSHSGGGASVTGGVFYDPPASQFPSQYAGDYFFGDFVRDTVRRLEAPAGGGSAQSFGFASETTSVVDLDVGPDGSLYYLSYSDYEGLVRVRYTASEAPQVTRQPEDLTVTAPAAARFMVSASGRGPLSYQWQRRGPGGVGFEDVAGATADSYTTGPTSAGDDGSAYRVVMTDAVGLQTISAAALLTVTSNHAPVVTITTPPAGTRYRGGQTVGFEASGSDPEGGALNFTWEVVFHHDTHTHPFVDWRAGSGGSFTIPDVGEHSADVFYRLHVRATDEGGLAGEAVLDLLPVTARLTLAGNVAGLTLELDGQPHAAPYEVVGVAGVLRTLGAPATQSVGGTTYEFVSWSDGGAREHALATPDADTTYTAVYRPVTAIAGRYVFYNNSFYDGRTGGAVSADDGAVATDKQALLPGQTATFANYTSFPGGVNGIMLDLTNGGMPVTAENFVFRAGNDADPGSWPAAPLPLSIERRNGAGAGGSDRVTITWPFGSIRNKWLQVSFRPQPGAAVSDVFYFGSAVGETGDNAADAVVNAGDLMGVRSHLRAAGGVASRWDLNRDGRVNVADMNVVRRYRTVAGRALALITAPVQSPQAASAVSGRTGPAGRRSYVVPAPILSTVSSPVASLAATHLVRGDDAATSA